LKEAGFEVTYAAMRDRELAGTSLADVLAPVDAVIAGTDAFPADVIQAASRLKIIARTGVGYDNIDVDAATQRDVVVCTTPGANRESVAEHVLALILNCARAIPQNIEAVKAGSWEQPSGREVSGATLGVVGLGSIGKSVVLKALALGMRVLAFDQVLDEDFIAKTGIEVRRLDDLLREADFVTLHLSLGESTYHLIDQRALGMMKRSAFLINTSRGGIVDERALVDALESGQLAGAALDVLESEPVPAGSDLLKVPNLIVTAHIAGATEQARNRSSLVATQQVIDYFTGMPVRHPVAGTGARQARPQGVSAEKGEDR
jgi:D-3-phosphoglycerate dehydrogenase